MHHQLILAQNYYRCSLRGMELSSWRKFNQWQFEKVNFYLHAWLKLLSFILKVWRIWESL